jgi:uncharacterized surface protein with fasciclin (FAS1) repeats
MSKKPILLLIAFFAFSLLVGAGTVSAQEGELDSQSQNATQTEQTIYEIIQAEPSLSDFEALIEAAALSDNLDQDGPFTVFAPTNAAWAAFNIMAKEDDPTEILLYHVLNGSYTAADLSAKWGVTTLSGESLFFNASVDDDNTSIVLNESVQVTRADIQASNGVIHVVDAVVSFPEGNSLFASELGSPESSIVEVLANDGRFGTLLAVVEQAGLTDELENMAAHYTLFAPTDEAFENVSPELLEEWLADTEGALTTILTYHIVNDRLSINQIATDRYIPTLEGRALFVTVDEDVQVYLNGRPVQEFNILAANGVIHVMDEVIMP